MTIKESLQWSTSLLEEKKTEQPNESANFLLRQLLSADKSYIITHPDKKLTLFQENKFKRWVKRRAKHEPVWYITRSIEFYGQDFLVNENVLIPRPETELLIEKTLADSKELKTNSRILDIGTGSGAIILSLAKELDVTHKYFASDISSKALAVAKKNAKRLKLDPVIQFKKGDLLSPWLGQRFDIIIANLPYIPHEDMSTLALDLLHYEPRTALDGEKNGLEIYERFFAQLPSVLAPNTKVYCEIGKDQGGEVKLMIKKSLPKAKVTIVSDYAKIDRIAIIET